MSVFFFVRRSAAVTVSALVCSLGFWPHLVCAQTLQELVITGNALSKAQNALNVTSLSGIALAEQGQSSLGETLNNLPGVSSTYFGPNASRPIVRGMDGDRIRVLSNSGASMDVSSLSYDHAVPMDVLSTERIEVLKGPAALQYGGSAMGGVVNVMDNRVPKQALEGVLGKAQLQGASGNHERSAGALLETGQGVWVMHADAFDRSTRDVQVPQKMPCTRPGSLAVSYRICNSASVSQGGALGGSLFFDQGFVGLSLNTYQSHYGTVAEDTVTIGMRSERLAMEGEWRPHSAWFQTVHWQASQSNYKHTEFDAGQAGTVFASAGQDLRIQGQHQRMAWGQSVWEGLWGLQMEAGHFSAEGAEAFAPFSQSKFKALFVIEDVTLGNLGMNWGLRKEDVTVASLGNPDPHLMRFEKGERQFAPQNFASAATWNVSSQWRLSGNLAHTERAPKDYELFANGPHIATAAWERGNSQLSLEKANSLDFSIDWQEGPHQLKWTAFQSVFSNYIGLLASTVLEEGLPVQIYQGVRAKFYGMESSGQWRLVQAERTLDLALKADAVRAQNLTTGEALPRISPLRVGASLIHAAGPWRGRFGFDWHAAQNRVPVGSVATDAYTLWSGSVNYKQKLNASTLNWFARLENASNQWAYSASSILTSTAPGKSPLPGRSLKLGVLAAF